jgi:hypothetical protein
MICNAAQWFDSDGRLTDVPTRARIQQFLAALVRLAR